MLRLPPSNIRVNQYKAASGLEPPPTLCKAEIGHKIVRLVCQKTPKPFTQNLTNTWSSLVP